MKNFVAPLGFTLLSAWVVVLFVLAHNTPGEEPVGLVVEFVAEELVEELEVRIARPVRLLRRDARLAGEDDELSPIAHTFDLLSDIGGPVDLDFELP